ncbi:hypothetical protein CPAR01_11051 [Colletotrichum paranaense]|uniref:Clr5 domain-containing protein n=1 Tax=Colletotrichum paranaense TaxID=1914294 RepID=A0ABQ9SAJ4_9PEZI|nr:uncharacterized protein CPAR01_11051 [Colletotrichum paranaense]KAK1531402.1 hypothetical protein CPAR01_11051 [Colletotrichum paranaense]
MASSEYMAALEGLGNNFWEPTTSHTCTTFDSDMTRTRAARKPADQWEGLKEVIRKEYKSKTLEELIIFLGEQYDLDVTKRQIVYRLGLWGFKKYGVTQDQLAIESIFQDGSYKYDQANQEIQAATAIFAAGGGGDGFAWIAYKDGYLNTEGHANRLVALCRSAETEQQIQEALDVLGQHKLQSGDQHILMYVHVLESMNDERCRNDKLQLEGPMARNVTDAVSSILDRSGKGFLLKADGTVDLFAFHLLDVIYERYSACLDKSQEDKLRILLDCLEGWVLSRDKNGATTSAALDTLRECVQWCSQRLEEVCTGFAQTKQTKRPDLCFPHSQDDLIWKEHLEVYGTLWYRLTLQQEAEKVEEGVKKAGEEDGAGWLGWACRARNDLGISHAEVLSYVCWVLVNYEANSTTGHGTGTVDMTTTANGYYGGSAGNEYNESSAESLFLRVKAAANVMNGAEPSILWHRFLYAFKDFNDLTGGNDEFGDVAVRAAEYKRFRGGIVAEFASFVREALSEFQDFKPGEARDCSCNP